MTLGVVGAVDEQAGDGGGQCGAAYGSGCVVEVRREGADAGGGCMQAGAELGEDCVAGGIGVEFGAKRGLLSVVELRAFSVAEQAVQAAGNVAEMECERRQTERTRVEFGIGERVAPFVYIQLGQLEAWSTARVTASTSVWVPLSQGSCESGWILGWISLIFHSPFRARKARTTAVTSWCCRSTASFMVWMSSALTLPASLSIAVWISGWRWSESSRTSGTAW